MKANRRLKRPSALLISTAGDTGEPVNHGELSAAAGLIRRPERGFVDLSCWPVKMMKTQKFQDQCNGDSSLFSPALVSVRCCTLLKFHSGALCGG
jgi:hypothetical protein